MLQVFNTMIMKNKSNDKNDKGMMQYSEVGDLNLRLTVRLNVRLSKLKN